MFSQLLQLVVYGQTINYGGSGLGGKRKTFEVDDVDSI